MTLRLRSRMPMAVACGAVALALIAGGCTKQPRPSPRPAARRSRAGRAVWALPPSSAPELHLPVREQCLPQHLQQPQLRAVDVPAAVLVRCGRPAASEPLAQPGQPADLVREHGHHHAEALHMVERQPRDHSGRDVLDQHAPRTRRWVRSTTAVYNGVPLMPS